MKRLFCFAFRAISFSFILISFCNFLAAQEFLGVGIHFAPPVRIDNCCNSYVEAKPILVPAYSFTFRKMWESKKEKSWYYEIGITSMSVGVNVRNYFNDTVAIWSEFNMTYLGFPSILAGGGRVFPLKGKSLKHDLSLGLEVSYRITRGFSYGSKNFGLDYSKSDMPFPLFLRLNGAYGVQFKFLRNIPFYLQAYGNLSFQDIARSPQYLRDPITGIANEDGKYRQNNSEIGLKLFANTDINYNKHQWVKKEKTPKEKGPLAYRISIEGQSYFPPATKHYIPKVDSFSLTGFKYALTHQAGIKTEFFYPGNSRWAAIVGLGLSYSYVTGHFKAKSSFTRNGQNIDIGPHGTVPGIHLIPNLGFAYKHPAGKKHIQHSVSATLVVPLEKEGITWVVFDSLYDNTIPIFLWPALLKEVVDYKYGRSNALFGLEYQPELLVHADQRFFYGIGLVFNYSWGVIAHGRATVDNGRTQYYGDIIQNFSKIGVTLRVGWNSARKP